MGLKATFDIYELLYQVEAELHQIPNCSFYPQVEEGDIVIYKGVGQGAALVITHGDGDEFLIMKAYDLGSSPIDYGFQT